MWIQHVQRGSPAMTEISLTNVINRSSFQNEPMHGSDFVPVCDLSHSERKWSYQLIWTFYVSILRLYMDSLVDLTLYNNWQ